MRFGILFIIFFNVLDSLVYLTSVSHYDVDFNTLPIVLFGFIRVNPVFIGTTASELVLINWILNQWTVNISAAL